MKTYSVFAYLYSDGGHVVQESDGIDATDAVVRLRDRIGVTAEDFEVIAVAEGAVTFGLLDESQMRLAPYSPAQWH